MSQIICCPRRHPTISSLCSCDNEHHSWESNCSSCRPKQFNHHTLTANQTIFDNLYKIVPDSNTKIKIVYNIVLK